MRKAVGSKQKTAGGKRRRLLLPTAFCLLFPAFALSAAECTDCHNGTDKKAPLVTVGTNSAHAGVECEECHTGVKVPHPDKMRPAQCKTCHADQAAALFGSSHGEKLKKYFLDKKGDASAPAACTACHSNDAHNILKVKDAGSLTARPNLAATCLTCHEKEQSIAVYKYIESVHGTSLAAGKLKAAVCTDCHGVHAINHSKLPNSSVYHVSIPQTCGACHPAEYSEYTASIHWQSVNKGFREAPVCTDCHGEHTIRSRRDPLSTSYAGNVTKTCASCHGSERLDTKFMITPGGVESLKDSFHGLSSGVGDIRVANCASCHGSHMILPRSDPRSFINPANLGRTCGICHPGAEKRFNGENERIHTTAKAPSHWIVGVVRQIYIWLIFLTIGGMLSHNLLDLLYKSAKGVPAHRVEVLVPRMSLNERIQHWVLTVCFLVLVVSGFARSYPDSPFAWPFKLFPKETSLWGIDGRGWVHRVAAFVFIALSLYHVGYLAVTKRGRQQVRELLPRFTDVRIVKNMMLKYLGLGNPQFQLPHYSYVEKAEYWALAWGTAIMSLTGLMLLFVDKSMSKLPLWLMDLVGTVHYWEAVLAALAILVWHGYWSVFDPEFYPMNMTWLTGHPQTGAQPHLPVHEPPPEMPAAPPTPPTPGTEQFTVK